MGWRDRDHIHFDTEKLESKAKAIESFAEQLENDEKTLTASLSTLRKDWVTGASKTFFEKYDDKWVKQLDGHIELLRELVKALRFAAQQYEPVAQEYGGINLDI